MVIVEDPFPLVASVNIAAMDLRAVLYEKKDGRFSPNARIRKVLIPKQYLVHKDELALKGKVSTTNKNEKNGRYPYNSMHEIKKEKPFKENNVFPKNRHTFPEGKGMNNSRRKIPPRFVVPPPISPGEKWHVVQHKKFPQMVTKTQKKKNAEIKSYGGKTIT